MAGNAFEIVMEHRQELVDKIVKMMKQGDFFDNMSEWNRYALRPYNPLSQVTYQGGNRLRLMHEVVEKGYTDPRWATFRQYKEKGYYPKAGEHGTLCEKWIFKKEKTIINENNEKVKVVEELEKPVVSYFWVFNGQQIKDFPAYQEQAVTQTELFDLADRLIQTSECPVMELAQPKAYYSLGRDHIVLPLREHFKDDVSFAKTLIHEMGHSTGHPSRLNRSMGSHFGSPEYAREELRAEIATLFTEADLGIQLSGEHYEDHSDYLKSWIQDLENDYNELFRACAAAEKISKRLVNNYVKAYHLEETREIKDTVEPKVNEKKAARSHRR